jgi:hypothetical protein
LAVSSFRFRARLGFSIPSLSSGQRGITPAFGYSAPHPGAGGTLTLLNSALLSAHYGPFRHPSAPGPSVTGFRLVVALDLAWGFPCCIGLPLVCMLSPLPRRNR